MSIKKKIALILSGLWVIGWFGISCYLRSPSPLIFSIIPLGLIWGIYLCFTRKHSSQPPKLFILPQGAAFKDPAVLTKGIKMVSYLKAAVSLLIFIGGISGVVLASKKELLASAAFIDGIAAILQTIFLYMWIYKTNFNSHQLGAKAMAYSPRAAVGWSFIPIGIYFVMREIWKISQDPRGQWQERSDALIGWWFLALFLGNFLLLLAKNMDDLYASLGYFIVTIGALLLIIIVDKICNRQISHHYNTPSSNIEISKPGFQAEKH